MIKIILVQGFCPLNFKITQFPDGFWGVTKQSNAVTSNEKTSKVIKIQEVKINK